MFDSVHARTCLHHAAYYGHVDCLDAILSTARTTPVAGSWGFARFVNVRDDHGATPLHLAARQGRPGCVQVLLENGAIVSALTGSYGFPGSTSLHLAARSGDLDCIRKLLAWGADRLQRDSAGRIPYVVAHKRNHGACAALLNPSSAEPMVWPSPLKFISELDPEAKALLEAALMEANREREKKILKDAKCSPQSPLQYDDDHIDDDMFSEVSSGERHGAVLHLLRPGVHHRGAGLRAPDVRALHAGAVLPQQAQPGDPDPALAGVPVLPRQHLAAGGGPDPDSRQRRPRQASLPAARAPAVPALSQPQ
uniref:Uncharacterized protein n=1 Tax=Aegilops tauschii subsp. strangulata TaxID=200361 RepID=A0A452XN63_AEGTS